ncbi:histidine kinase [uncultured Fluviicola sp.]|uniref:sensor histidine kinase n=1 Tax=uncultured Fluviicola sp. TaxID=463303 RepID=UPI0025F206DF|nr:histidine kinase [uncultured Fluviicola sp.]
MIKSLLSGLLFSAIAWNAAARSNRISWDYNYAHYGIGNGLPSSETYQVYQDHAGILWILTDRGIVCYDGYGFHTYTTENGLADNVNFRTVEDPGGGVWFIGYNGLLSVFRDGKMQPYRYNGLIKKKLKTVRNPIVSAHVNQDLSIVYSSFKNGLFTISAHGQLKELPIKSVHGGSFWQFGNDFLPHYHITNTSNDPVDVFLIRNNRKWDIGKLFLSITVRVKEHKKHLFLLSDHKAYMNDGKQFDLVSGGQPAIALDVDKEFVYIGYYKGGVKKFRFDPKTKKLLLVSHYLPGFSVTSALSDLNGALWFSTLEKGVFAIHDEAFKQLSINGSRFNGDVRFITGNKDKVVLTHYVGKWQQLYPPYRCKDVGKMIYRYNLVPFKDGFVFSQGLIDWGDWPDVYDLFPGNPIYVKGTGIIGSSRPDKPVKIMEMGQEGNILRILLRLGSSAKLSGSFSHYHIGSDKHFFGLFDQGVYAADIKNQRFDREPYPILTKRISLLKYNPAWGLIACSNSEGLFRIDPETEKVSGFASGLGLGKQVLTFCFDEKDRLWVATRRGIFLLVNNSGKISVDSFLDSGALSSAEITDSYVYDNLLYLATKEGVQKIDWMHIKKRLKVFPLSLFSVKAFANNKQLTESRVFPSQTDLIKIFLYSKNLDKSPEYRYRFNEDETWITSNKGEIIINNPADGNYSLEIAYLDAKEKWSDPKILYNFSVEKVIFLRWYFILLYVGLIILLFYGVLKYTVRAASRKNELLNRMMELERMALSAQMNPHFIFNSLNSIHSFLLYEENENAEKYLLRFAKLIRQTLANSRVSYITVSEEHETLNNYVLLEKMRFKNNFSYRIDCNFKELPQHACIPPMLIQPYVENAIIHGLSKKTTDAELFIGFYREGELLKVVIRDNGIGYKESIKNKRDNGHKSYGTLITEERLKSFQEKSKDGFSVRIREADEFNTEFPGTEVVLTIPIPNN